MWFLNSSFFFFVNIIELMLKVLNSMIIWFKIHCSGAKLCKNYESSFNNCGLNCLAIRFSVQKKLLLGTVCLHKTSGYQAMMLHTAPGSTLFFFGSWHFSRKHLWPLSNSPDQGLIHLKATRITNVSITKHLT